MIYFFWIGGEAEQIHSDEFRRVIGEVCRALRIMAQLGPDHVRA